MISQTVVALEKAFINSKNRFYTDLGIVVIILITTIIVVLGIWIGISKGIFKNIFEYLKNKFSKRKIEEIELKEIELKDINVKETVMRKRNENSNDSYIDMDFNITSNNAPRTSSINANRQNKSLNYSEGEISNRMSGQITLFNVLQKEEADTETYEHFNS